MIVLFVVIAIFVSSLIIVFALSIIQPGSTIEAIAIPIAFLNIFATGYGAYLGAKISGDNATKLMKEQLVISEFNQNSKADITFLREFNDLIKYYNFEKFANEKLDVKYIYNFVDLYNKLIELDFMTCSSIIKFEFLNLISEFEKVYYVSDSLIYKLNKSINDYYLENCYETCKENTTVRVSGLSFEKLNVNYCQKKEKSRVYVAKYDKYGYVNGNNEDDFYDYINVEEAYNYITSKYQVDIMKNYSLLKDLYSLYNNLTVKKEDELGEIILNYYSINK